MEINKQVVQAVLVTLGAAFVLLSVNEWKKLADMVPNDDGTVAYSGMPSADHVNKLVCIASGPAVPPAGTAASGTSLDVCEKMYGSNVPWTQGIKAFVYSWIGVGLLVAAFLKGKGGVAGGYW